MNNPQNSAWKTRLVEHGFPDRSFDIEFWQEQGDEAIFSAAWDLVELAEEVSHGRKPTLMKYGEPRYTKDLDVWVHNSPQNSARVVGALRQFGAPLERDGITIETFTGKQVVYQMGIAPVRIDILTEITGVEFPDAWGKRVASTFFGIPVYFISLDDLVTNKQALGRSSDLKDLKRNPKGTC
jgi:hypothetical protein